MAKNRSARVSSRGAPAAWCYNAVGGDGRSERREAAPSRHGIGRDDSGERTSVQQHKAAVRLRRGSFLVLLALLVGAALPALNATFVARVTPHTAQTRAGARAALYPFTDVNPYGANTFLSKEVEDWKRERFYVIRCDV